MKRIYLPMQGGLGDILNYHYFKRGAEAGYLADIKAKYPDTYVRAMICGCNRQSEEFFAKHPHIDNVLWHPPVPDRQEVFQRLRGDCERLRDAFDIRLLRNEPPSVYMDAAEDEAASQIRSQGKYVCLHPFAGTPNRAWEGHLGVRRVIDLLCDAGCRVVVLGGSSTRYEAARTRELKEELTYQRGAVVNLVNRYSVRLHAHLTRHAYRFVGSLSAYCSVAIPCGVPSLIFTARNARQNLESQPNSMFASIKEAKSRLICWDELSAIDLSETLYSLVLPRSSPVCDSLDDHRA